MYILILLLVPNVFLYFKTEQLNIFLLSLISIVWIFAVFKNSKSLVILFPFFLFAPVVVFYIYFYGAMLDEQVLSIILETNIQEAKAFVGSYLYVFIGWVFILIFILFISYNKNFVWLHYSRLVVLSLFSIYFFIEIMMNQNVANKIDANLSSQNFLVEEKNSFIQEVKKTYPLGLIVSLYDLFKEQNKINNTFYLNNDFKFGSVLKNDNKKQIVVLVIGESSRRENWQLNGYHRATTPFLMHQKNLVNFNNMISISNATRSSIPMILTRKPAEQVFNYIFKEKSIISAFKEAGFHTYWLSTQQKFGTFDTSTSVYVKEADHVIFLNKANYINKGDLDGILVPKFREIINSKEEKKFIVIHMLGSHYNYTHRYPIEFNKFKPSLNDLQNYNLQNNKYKYEMVNSYDNSILYTDYVLNAFIRNLNENIDIESFLLFSSDHGEDLFDNGCNKSGHGNRTIYNFDVASFIWYSDLFYNKNRVKVNELRRNVNEKINQTSIFPSLVDAADIKIPNYSLERSLLRRFSKYPRYIMGGVNYDKVKHLGICRDVE